MISLLSGLFALGMVIWFKAFLRHQAEMQEKYLTLNLDLNKKLINQFESLKINVISLKSDISYINELFSRPLPVLSEEKPKKTRKRKRVVSEEQRKRVSEIQKKRWASASQEDRKNAFKKKKAAQKEQPQQEVKTIVAQGGYSSN